MLALVGPLVGLFWSSPGVADAPSLPLLGDARPRIFVDTSLGSLRGSARSVAAFEQVFGFETNAAEEAYRIGFRYAMGGGETFDPTRARQVSLAPSNVGVWFRAQTVTLHGLSFSAGAVVALPTSWVPIGGIAENVALSVRSLRLDHRSDFVAKGVGVAPHVDVRVHLGWWTVQLRQSLDATLQLSSSAQQSTTATSVVYVGADLGKFTPGIELVHLYLLDGTAPDADRRRLTLLPHLRWRFRSVQTTLGMVYGAPPYNPAAAEVVGVRLGITAPM